MKKVINKIFQLKGVFVFRARHNMCQSSDHFFLNFSKFNKRFFRCPPLEGRGLIYPHTYKCYFHKTKAVFTKKTIRNVFGFVKGKDN